MSNRRPKVALRGRPQFEEVYWLAGAHTRFARVWLSSVLQTTCCMPDGLRSQAGAEGRDGTADTGLFS